MARRRTAALLLAALAAAALLAGAAADGAAHMGPGAHQQLIDKANQGIAAKEAVINDPKGAASAAKNATVAHLLTQWAKAGAAVNNKTAALRVQLNERVHSALDKAAVVLNGAAAAAGAKVNPAAGHANATAQAAKAAKDDAVRERVAAAAGAVGAVTGKVEQRVMPIRNQIANATAGLKKEFQEASQSAFKGAIAANQYFSALRTNLTAPLKRPFQAQQDQANAALAALLRWQLERMIAAGETAASATNTLDKKFGTFEQFLHNFTDPADRAAKGKRVSCLETAKDWSGCSGVDNTALRAGAQQLELQRQQRDRRNPHATPAHHTSTPTHPPTHTLIRILIRTPKHRTWPRSRSRT